MYNGIRNITISLDISSTPKHRNLHATFNLINEHDETEVELKLHLLDGVIKKSDLTSKNTNINVLNICSDFIQKLSLEEFEYKK